MACVALRTHLTLRELAAVVGFSKSTVHRVVWRRHRRRRARAEHVLARLKDWRVLRDRRRRCRRLAATVAAVTVLHNLRLNLWDSSWRRLRAHGLMR